MGASIAHGMSLAAPRGGNLESWEPEILAGSEWSQVSSFPEFRAPGIPSVSCLEDCHDLAVSQHVLPEKVVMPGVHPADLLVVRERQVAIGIQTRHDPQGIRRQRAIVIVAAANRELPVCIRRDVNSTVGQTIN